MNNEFNIFKQEIKKNLIKILLIAIIYIYNFI